MFKLKAVGDSKRIPSAASLHP